MKFTIDTEIDSYEDAIRTVRAAYGVPERAARGRPVVLDRDVVWKPPGPYGLAPWTEAMLRSWVQSLTAEDELNLVWRVCAQPGHPGVHEKVLAEYVSPHLRGQPAVTEMADITRRLNDAAQELWASATPYLVNERDRTRTVDRAVAKILLNELASHPLWPRMRHHADPPALDVPGT
ncbi:hypothetical protein [Streptomyces sp. NPDC000880]